MITWDGAMESVSPPALPKARSTLSVANVSANTGRCVGQNRAPTSDFQIRIRKSTFRKNLNSGTPVCQFQSDLSGFCDGYVSVCGADDAAFSCGFDRVAGDVGDGVDIHDTMDLGAEACDQPEVSAGDADDQGQGLDMRESVGIEVQVKRIPVLENRNRIPSSFSGLNPWTPPIREESCG